MHWSGAGRENVTTLSLVEGGTDMSESQKVTKQAALTTASGRTWLIVAGILTGLSLIMLWAMRELPPLGAATTGFVIVIVLFLAMVAVRFGITQPRARLIALALLTIAIVATFITVAGMIIFA